MLWHAIAWGLVLLGLGLWSLLCWALHAVLDWDGWRRGLDWEQLPRLELPPWLADWLGLDGLPGLRELLVEIGPRLQGWLEALPPLDGWLAPLLVLLWAVGALLLLGLGGIASLALHWMHRPQNPRP